MKSPFLELAEPIFEGFRRIDNFRRGLTFLITFLMSKINNKMLVSTGRFLFYLNLTA